MLPVSISTSRPAAIDRSKVESESKGGGEDDDDDNDDDDDSDGDDDDDDDGFESLRATQVRSLPKRNQG